MADTNTTPTPAGLTAARLAEIRERVEAATYGPYRVVDENAVYGEGGDLLVMGGPMQPQGFTFPIARVVRSDPRAAANAAFLAGAYVDVRTLLSTCARLTAALDAATAAREQAERERDELWNERTALREAAFFFSSVIRSGEPWTEQCEAALARATAPLGTVGG